MLSLKNMATDRSKAFKAGKTVAKRVKTESKKSRSIRTFNLDDELYGNFKRRCLELDLKMSAVVDDFIRGYLSESNDGN